MYDPNTPQDPNSFLSDTDSMLQEHAARLFTRTGMWYFRTREGKDVGPFRYKDEAELMLTRFVEELHQLELERQQMLVGVKPHFRISAVLGRRDQG